MTKLVSLEKNSFTLIETLLSLIIISVIISGFTKFINNPSKLSTYNELQNTHNNYQKNGAITDGENFVFSK
jgi:Tfp pilus assembly protein PilV